MVWGCDVKAVNVHLWQKMEQRQRQGVKIIVIDPHRNRTAVGADWHLPIKIGTDAALAIGIVHVLVRDGKCDEDYLANHTLGFEQWKPEVVAKFPPQRVAEITGLSVDDVERLAAMYGATKKSFLRIGWGMTRARARRPGDARGRDAAGGHRRLRRARRRRDVGHRRLARFQFCAVAQAVRTSRRRDRSTTACSAKRC